MFNFIMPSFIFKIERWKWNSEYRVYASTLGNFKNEHKQNLPIKINQSGYCKIKTECGFQSAHRIVMKTWRPIPDAEHLTVDHLNHNKRDNSLYNLEWVTQSENLKRAKDDYVVTPEDPKPVQTIKAGQMTFATMDEAIDYCINKHGISGTTRERIQKRIENSMNFGSCYCGRKWKRI